MHENHAFKVVAKPFIPVTEPYLLIMEYVMYGKLLQHLRDQRSKQSSFFTFSEGDHEGVDGGDGTGDGEKKTLTAKDLTKYAYGVAKGMEYIVSKGVSGYVSGP